MQVFIDQQQILDSQHEIFLLLSNIMDMDDSTFTDSSDFDLLSLTTVSVYDDEDDVTDNEAKVKVVDEELTETLSSCSSFESLPDVYDVANMFDLNDNDLQQTIESGY
jgi:hypothetical protein